MGSIDLGISDSVAPTRFYDQSYHTKNEILSSLIRPWAFFSLSEGNEMRRFELYLATTLLKAETKSHHSQEKIIITCNVMLLNFFLQKLEPVTSSILNTDGDVGKTLQAHLNEMN